MQHFRNPRSLVPGSRMPPLNLPERELRDLTAYIQSLR